MASRARERAVEGTKQNKIPKAGSIAAAYN